MLGTVVPITALTMMTIGNLKSCLQQVLLCRNSPINRAGNHNKTSTRIPSGKQLSLLLLNLCGLKGVWWTEGTKTRYWLLSDMKFESCCTNSIKEQAITFKACSKEWNALIISLVHTTALSKTLCSWSGSYLRQISSSFNSTRLDRTWLKNNNNNKSNIFWFPLLTLLCLFNLINCWVSLSKPAWKCQAQ